MFPLSLRARVLALLLWVAGLLIAALPLEAAQAMDTTQGVVVLTPVDAQGAQLPGPGYYQISAAPGSTTQVYALVGNMGSEKVKISVVPVDARSGVYGGVSYNLPQARRKLVGAWIQLAHASVVVRPGKGRIMRVTVHVPARVAPGQYVGGLTAYVPSTGSTTVGNSSGSNGAIKLQLRRVVAVVVTVPGPQITRLTVTKMTAARRPDAYYLLANIKNTGNTLVKGAGNMWLWRQGVRKPVLTGKLAIDTTVPHTTVHYPIHWLKQPRLGTYHYRVSIWWNGGKMTRDGSFVLR